MGSSKKPLPLWAQVAQSVEQRIENPRVGSSILSLGTIRTTPVYDFNVLEAKTVPLCSITSEGGTLSFLFFSPNIIEIALSARCVRLAARV